MKSNGAIALFDSGLGGLTVLKILMEHLPNESFIYLGDTARLPYGTKSLDTIHAYVRQNVGFLKRLDVKALVIACHSASSAILKKPLTDDVPLYEVITPSCEMALEQTPAKKVGVIATRTTVLGGAYPRSFGALNTATQVFQQACPLLVPLVEEGWEEDPITSLIVFRYLSQLPILELDALILGCTHYPILESAIRKVVGRDFPVIQPGFAVLDRLKKDMESGVLSTAAPKPGPANLKIFTTDTSDRFWEVAQRILSPIDIPEPQHVDINAADPFHPDSGS